MPFDIAPPHTYDSPVGTGSPEKAPVKAEPSSVPGIRVVFMGTPEFSETILSGLIGLGYDVVAVYTRPDKPVGRKREPVPSAVKRIATDHGIPLEQPDRFDEEAVRRLRGHRPDLIVVAAYGRILPPSVLSVPEFGCLNVHASLLPRWRGASPVQNALLAGDTETGTTIMLMDAGMDTGPILAQAPFPISDNDTRDSLLTRMAEDGVRLLAETVPEWIANRIGPKDQDGSLATLCQLIEREDGRIFWNDSAVAIRNRYRALHPWPGVFTFWKREDGLIRLKLTEVSIQKTDPSMKRKFGEVFEIGEKIAVQTGEGLLFIGHIQPEGKASMPIRDFLNGRPEFIGSLLG